jgi:hypothetical protein
MEIQGRVLNGIFWGRLMNAVAADSCDGIQIIDHQLLVRRRRLAFNFRERERGVISLQFKT